MPPGRVWIRPWTWRPEIINPLNPRSSPA